MKKTELEIMLEVIESINSDWALCDNHDEDDFMTLVDSNRTTKEDLKPLKTLVKLMEDEGLIVTNYDYDKREYMKLLGEMYPIPFVYMYTITKKGDAFYEKYKQVQNIIKQWKIEYNPYGFFEKYHWLKEAEKTEDILQLIQSQNYTLDVGWYGDNRYRIFLIYNQNWEKPFKIFESKSAKEIEEIVLEWLIEYVDIHSQGKK